MVKIEKIIIQAKTYVHVWSCDRTSLWIVVLIKADTSLCDTNYEQKKSLKIMKLAKEIRYPATSEMLNLISSKFIVASIGENIVGEV